MKLTLIASKIRAHLGLVKPFAANAYVRNVITFNQAGNDLGIALGSPIYRV